MSIRTREPPVERARPVSLVSLGQRIYVWGHSTFYPHRQSFGEAQTAPLGQEKMESIQPKPMQRPGQLIFGYKSLKQKAIGLVRDATPACFVILLTALMHQIRNLIVVGHLPPLPVHQTRTQSASMPKLMNCCHFLLPECRYHYP